MTLYLRFSLNCLISVSRLSNPLWAEREDLMKRRTARLALFLQVESHDRSEGESGAASIARHHDSKTGRFDAATNADDRAKCRGAGLCGVVPSFVAALQRSELAGIFISGPTLRFAPRHSANGGRHGVRSRGFRQPPMTEENLTARTAADRVQNDV